MEVFSNPIPLSSLNPHAAPFPHLSSSFSCSWSKKLFLLSHIPESRKLAFWLPVCKGDEKIAVCSKAETSKTKEKWKDALQGFFADKNPFFPSMLVALERSWKVQDGMEVFLRQDNSIIITFRNSIERSRILNSGPWFILGRYLHLGPWSRLVRSRNEFFATLPVWIWLPNLPLHFRSLESIGKIVSMVGKPLYMDDYSASQNKIRFVRVCVEIAAENPIPTSIHIEVDDCSDEAFLQQIEFESEVKICCLCKSFGHVDEDCFKSINFPPIVTGKKAKVPRPRELSLVGSKPLAFADGHPAQGYQDGSKDPTNLDPGWTKVQRKKNNRFHPAVSNVARRENQGKKWIPVISNAPGCSNRPGTTSLAGKQVSEGGVPGGEFESAMVVGASGEATGLVSSPELARKAAEVRGAIAEVVVVVVGSERGR